VANAFQFWNISPFEIPLIVTASLYFTFIQRHLGLYLIKRSGLGAQILVGLCTSAGILAFLISFSAELGRLFIYVEGLLLTGMELRHFLKFRKTRLSLRQISLSLVTISLVTIFTFFTVFRTFTPNGKLIVNAHQIYMSGISIEILNSDYFTRIRILDNYPLVFEKFHFLNATMSAIIMAPTLHFSYLTFLISKFIVFLIAALVGFELLSAKFGSGRRAFQAILLFSLGVFLVLPTSMVWASNTNNSLPILLILAGLLAFAADQNRSSLAFLLFFSISTSRSLIPGLTLIFLIFLVQPFRCSNLTKASFFPFVFQVTRQKLALDKSLRLLFGAFLLGLSSLVLTGYAPKPLGRKTLVTTFTEPLKKLFPTDWLGVMSPGSFGLSDVINQNTYYISQNYRTSFFFFCLVAFIQILCLGKPYLRHAMITRISLIVLLLLYLVAWLTLPKDALLTVFADYYVAPILIILFLAPRQVQLPLAGFISVSLAQIMLLGPDVAIPNWHVTEWLCVSFVSLRLITSFGNIRYLTLTLSCLVLLVQFSDGPNMGSLFRQDGRDSTTHEIQVDSLPVMNPTLKAWCHTNDDEDAIMAIRGNRIFANSDRSGRYTVTRDFIRERLKLQPLPSIVCRN
jgi:hypothetical protein